MPLPLFEQDAARGLKVVSGNRPNTIAHTKLGGNEVYVDRPDLMTEPILAHEVFHKIQEHAGALGTEPNLKTSSYKDIYNYGGTEGLRGLSSISKLNPEQQASIPQNYQDQMNAWSKQAVTPKMLQQADALNGAFARPIQQEANMAMPGMNVTPAPPGPPPSTLTGMIKPLPQIGGKSLYSK